MKKLFYLLVIVIFTSCSHSVSLEDKFSKENCVSHLVELSSSNRESFEGLSLYEIRKVLDNNGKNKIKDDLLNKLEGKTYKDVLQVLILEDHESKKPPINKKYENLKKEYQLFGSWVISNNLTNYKYEYEIYVKDDKYIGVQITKGKYKFENLIKNGVKYIVEDNKYGEFYAIDDKLNMLLYDQDGELKSAGYEATKKW